MANIFSTLIGTSGIVGLAIGMVFGGLIGHATTEDDAYLYRDAIQNGNVLVMVKFALRRLNNRQASLAPAQPT